MNNSAYWQKRQAAVREKLVDITIAQSERALKKAYRTIGKKYVERLTELAKQIEEGRSKSKNPLYEYRKFYKLLNEWQEDAKALGVKQNDLMTEELTTLYKRVDTSLAPAFPGPGATEAQIKQVLDTAWVASDGKLYSQRIWDSLGKLGTHLRDGMLEVFSGALTTEQLKRELATAFNTSYSNASRLVRTEYVHFANQAAANRMSEAGVTHYKWLTGAQERACEACMELDGKVFAVGDITHLPPAHPNCRCSIVAVFDSTDDGNK